MSKHLHAGGLVKLSNIIFSILSLLTFSIASSASTFSEDQKRFLADEKNTISTFKDRVGAVVNVSNLKVARRSFFDMTAVDVPVGAGSGFVWNKDGYIVTNYHVVQGGDKFHITFHKDKTQYKAKLVGAEPKKDIAVLKLEKMPKNLTNVEVGTSKDLLVGQKSMAIGSPFGLDHTITSGIISSLGRKIKGIGGVKIHGMIQTDSSINPGNSGGPLLDSSGKLIGMNTAIYSSSGSSSGIGFAVPVDTISKIVPQLIKHGKVIRPSLGIEILSNYERLSFGIDKGIVVTIVYDKSGAAKAGLEGISRDRYGRYYLGDIITHINDTEVNDYEQIYHALDKFKIGDVVEVRYIREDKVKRTKVKLSQFSGE
jgi:S1-C subfamily serine protease